MARRCFGVFLVFLVKLMMAVSQEYTEEDDLKGPIRDEYEQIFYNIPTLFEYLLEMLERRPEILESDDYTIFHDMPQKVGEGLLKREIKETNNKCENDDDVKDVNEIKNIKRSIVTKYINTGNNINYSTDTPRTEMTVENESSTGEFEETKYKITQVENDLHGFNKMIATKVAPEFSVNKSKLKKTLKNTSKEKLKDKKRNVINFGDSFLGSIDWTKFYLSPEEVEEQALNIEKAIEEHNRKKKER